MVEIASKVMGLILLFSYAEPPHRIREVTLESINVEIP